jgi:hypothetical protein
MAVALLFLVFELVERVAGIIHVHPRRVVVALLKIVNYAKPVWLRI